MKPDRVDGAHLLFYSWERITSSWFYLFVFSCYLFLDMLTNYHNNNRVLCTSKHCIEPKLFAIPLFFHLSPKERLLYVNTWLLLHFSTNRSRLTTKMGLFSSESMLDGILRLLVVYYYSSKHVVPRHFNL